MKTIPRKECKGFYFPERDGITQSLLGSFATCRFKSLWYLKGWVPKKSSYPLTFGTIIHAVLELVYEDIRLKKMKSLPSQKQTMKYIAKIEKMWKAENPRCDKEMAQNLELALLVAESTMPTYFEYWSKDIKQMRWEKIEGKFKIPFELDDGRKTFLRGKMDGVYRNKGRWLMETKTKGRIEEGQLVDYLSFELQNMLYLRALRDMGGDVPKGILYNIIRRSGLRQGKKESLPEYAKRINEDIIDRPEFYFIRLEISITKDDYENFDRELYGMVKDFYDWFDGKIGHWRNTSACETKYGRCEYLTAEAGSLVSYEKRKAVFRELEDM